MRVPTKMKHLTVPFQNWGTRGGVGWMLCLALASQEMDWKALSFSWLRQPGGWGPLLWWYPCWLVASRESKVETGLNPRLWWWERGSLDDHPAEMLRSHKLLEHPLLYQVVNSIPDLCEEFSKLKTSWKFESFLLTDYISKLPFWVTEVTNVSIRVLVNPL